MNDFGIARDDLKPSHFTPVAVADDAGMIWMHANPAELYRWISRRNALLSTIGVAFDRQAAAAPRPMVG